MLVSINTQSNYLVIIIFLLFQTKLICFWKSKSCSVRFVKDVWIGRKRDFIGDDSIQTTTWYYCLIILILKWFYLIWLTLRVVIVLNNYILRCKPLCTFFLMDTQRGYWLLFSRLHHIWGVGLGTSRDGVSNCFIYG